MQNLTVPQMKNVIKRQFKGNPLRALFFWGPPGVGKTDAVNQAAGELGVPVVELRLGTLTPTDLRGVPVPNRDTRMTEWYAGAFLPEPSRDGEKGILFLDEYNQSVPSMQALGQRLLLERRIGDNYYLPDGWLVVANGNRVSDRASVQSMPSQTQNRFKHFEVHVSLEAFINYAARQGFHPHIIAFLSQNPDLLHSMAHSTQNTPAWPSPRTWEIANEDYLVSENPEDLYPSVGQAAVGQFIAWQTVLSELPDVQKIIAGEGVAESLPETLAARYATVSILAGKATEPAGVINGHGWLQEQNCPAELLQLFMSQTIQRSLGSGREGVMFAELAKVPAMTASVQQILAMVYA